ncbi:MAG: hypothetical protein NVSMB14_09440 [Isosphaeraceae bacterium]
MVSSAVFWPALCVILGLVLLIGEVFIPTGGFIGLLAVGLILVGIGVAFGSSTSLGLTVLASLGVLLPVTLALAVNLWPRTPMAKWIFLKPPEPIDVESEDQGPKLSHLIGQFGRALTPLRPSGLVDFDGRKLDGLSEGAMIPTGALVRAVQVRGGQIIVREADEQTLDDLLN